MLFDYHTHTPRCHHARGEPVEFAQRAYDLGLDELGFSDHAPWIIQHPGQQVAMRPDELPAYVHDIQQLREQFARTADRPFRIRLGLEMDYVPSRIDAARAAMQDYRWDYLMGSIHHIGLTALTSPRESRFLFERCSLEEIAEMYFAAIERMVAEGFCDVITHLDLPRKYGDFEPGAMLRWVQPLIPRIKAAGMAVEINTSGVDHPIGQPYPERPVIQALVEAGVPLMVTSDAHTPEQIGRHLEQAYETLRQLGVTQLVRFEDRRMIPTPMPSRREIDTVVHKRDQMQQV